MLYNQKYILKEGLCFMLKEFKEFALKGNVLDLAIAVVMGAAFNKIVTSLVQYIIMPLMVNYLVQLILLKIGLFGD